MKFALALFFLLGLLFRYGLGFEGFTVLFWVPLCYLLVASVYTVGERGCHWWNEFPNGLRVFLVMLASVFPLVNLASAVVVGLCFWLGLMVNDEAIRRVVRLKGVIVLTGVDSSGKSTHARHIAEWLRHRGKRVRVLHFDRYLLLSRISESRSGGNPGHKLVAKSSRFSVLRPYLALLDNIVMFLVYALPSVALGEFVVCDRFIWDNWVKHKALGYRQKLDVLSVLVRPRLGFWFDVPSDVAYRRVADRRGHFQYSREQYDSERQSFRWIANVLGLERVDSTSSFRLNQMLIKSSIERRLF